MLAFGLSLAPGRGRAARDITPASVPGLVAWYDAFDQTTLFQSSFGGDAVSSNGAPIGTALPGNRREPELSGALTFPDLVWTDNGDGSYTRDNDSGFSAFYLNTGLSASYFIGKLIRVSFDYTLEADSPSRILVYRRGQSDLGNESFAVGAFGTSGRYDGYIRVVGPSDRPVWIDSNGGRYTIRNFRLREVAGHVLMQTTAAARPTYGDNGSHRWIAGDGVDDVLQLAEPVQYQTLIMVLSHAVVQAAVVALVGAVAGGGTHYVHIADATTLSLDGGTMKTGRWKQNDGPWTSKERNPVAPGRDLLSRTPYVLSAELEEPQEFRNLLHFENGSTVRYGNVRIYGAAFYDRILTDAEHALVYRYMAGKAGL